MSKNEEGDFQGEPGSCDGVNLLGKPGGELTERRLNAFTKILNERAWRWMVRLFAVLSAGSLLLAAASLVEQVLGHVVGVVGISIE